MATTNDSRMLCERAKQMVRWLISQGYAASQRELAQLMGYKESSFSQIINGRVPMSEKFVNRLVAVDRNLNSEWLLQGAGNMLGSLRHLPSAESDERQDAEFYKVNPKGAKFYKKDDRWFISVRHVPFAAYGRFANESDRLDCDAVILDECSMVDIQLMDALLRALPPDARRQGARQGAGAGQLAQPHSVQRLALLGGGLRQQRAHQADDQPGSGARHAHLPLAQPLTRICRLHPQ